MQIVNIILEVSNGLEAVANLLFAYAALKWADGFRLVRIELSCGSFLIRKRDISLTNVTALVSEYFFSGGWVPPTIRAEIIRLTVPGGRKIEKREFDEPSNPPE